MRFVCKPALAAVLIIASGSAAAQQYSGFYSDMDRQSQYPVSDVAPAYGDGFDYARVVRVQPVTVAQPSSAAHNPRCYTRQEQVGGYYPQPGYDPRDGGYRDDGYYGDGYGYGNAGYGGYRGQDSYRQPQAGSAMGRNVATVIGGIVGAAVGSKVGGGSARYATSAIGSMVGGMAGQQVYDQSVRNRQPPPQTATVRVCDPEPYGTATGNPHYDSTEYDVTYEYAGRQHTQRMRYHPGERVRVRVAVAE